MTERNENHEFMTQIDQYRTEYEGRYVVNEDKMEKFVMVFDFFCRLAEEEDGTVSAIDVSPTSKYASISVEVPSVEMRGDELKEFIALLTHIGSLQTSAATEDNLVISVGVSHVWEVVG